MWQWAHWRRAEASAGGSNVLHVNLDEARVQLVPGRERGNAARASTSRARRRLPTRSAPLAEQRGGFTRVAAACDNPTAQPMSPQVLAAPAGTPRGRSCATWNAGVWE
eukprot:2857148-Lingulodinium_polyedra.AAC.1